MMDEETLALFRSEAEGLIESLEARLLTLQTRPTDRELIDGVFRDLHTLKGSGAMFGRTDIAGFLHDFESAFEAVRSGSFAVDDELIMISLAARDHVAALLAADGGAGSGEEAILQRLAAHLKGGPVADGADAGEWMLRFYLPPDTLTLGGRPDLALQELRDLGATRTRALINEIPPFDELDPLNLHLGWEVALPGSVSEDDIRAVFLFHEQGLRLEMEKAEAPEDAATVDAVPVADHKPEEGARSPRSGQALMRVPAERLDDMMDRVGELVIAEARLIEIAGRSGDPALVAVAEDIQRLASAMRDTTMSIRMTPIGTIAGRFRRLAHDLSDRLGRPIAFTISGEETELDKTVVERLTEPLMHIVRNAADHGLEPAQERCAMGKPACGTIHLSARYSGAEVLISLSDDGRGINRDAVRARAIERGLLPEGAEPDDATLFDLIFAPGFSTTDEVSDLSGRGVGMDVVRRTIEDLRGTIEVQSEPGHGATITLRLPLTLAIIDGLLVETAKERFVIPLAAVDEIVELPEALAAEGAGNAFLDIRDSLVPFLRLRRILDSPGQAGAYQKVVVVTSSEGRVGIVVDRIIGSHQTVIKQLSPLHAGVKAFSGATILGDGTVSLILDVAQLVQRGRTMSDNGRQAA
ncbi:chemotaxis protein CheA [Pseudooceanicola sediminis]|uniref:Chemotaxis protein CheA n=1 Tax=Pseudooceanicola sediminis TaxID=2211117 RepID=A0A399IYG7_9RHOB|nr:chemotaxis protein CheA [Pseudooceanicola sediminis]KAA2311404.1 chemotaxis protein CheA [Puniceibacterium sp. HSS470]RII38024.1 chemotaxis protein CheA [Pseudooceanicola sediminis]|tara:strand:+ start:10921 stop:12840 length:1920 start_codon:yes stop_codon:yes gene_type:complete